MRSMWVAAMACLVLVGCQPKKQDSLRIDPSLEAMIPAGTPIRSCWAVCPCRSSTNSRGRRDSIRAKIFRE